MKKILIAIATVAALLGLASISYTNHLERKRAEARKIQLQGDCRLLSIVQGGAELNKRYLESHPDDPKAKEYAEDSAKKLQAVEAVCNRVAEWEKKYGEKFYP